MGKAGRFVCILTPMALAIASLVCLLLVFLGNLSTSEDGFLRSLYFFYADTRGFNGTATLPSTTNAGLDRTLAALLTTTYNSANLAPFYTVGLWNYCQAPRLTPPEMPSYCSPRKAGYAFDPAAVWGLGANATTRNATVAAAVALPQKLEDGLALYRRVAGWMFWVYVVASVATAAEVVVGCFAVFSRWGSFVTTIVSIASGLSALAAALLSTILYAALAAAFDSALRPYGIRAGLGAPMLRVVWLAVACSWAAGLFWLFSACCCGGGGAGGRKKGTPVEKTPYTYDRVGAPAGQEQWGEGVAMRDLGAAGKAYEPFRHQAA